VEGVLISSEESNGNRSKSQFKFRTKLEEISVYLIFPKCLHGPLKTLRQTACGPRVTHLWLNQTTLIQAFLTQYKTTVKLG